MVGSVEVGQESSARAAGDGTRRRATLRVVEGDTSVRVDGSDVRVKGGVTDKCKLCRKRATLRRSHVVPRAAYRPLKDEGAVRGVLHSRGVTVESQDGLWHYMLCDECEQYLGVAEKHLIEMMRSVNRQTSDTGQADFLDGFGVRGVDPLLVFRALRGVLLKAHYASGSPFEGLRLNRPEVDELRSSILLGTPIKLGMIIVPTKWFAIAYPDLDVTAMVLPDFQRFEGGYIFDVTMLGWSWTLVKAPSKNEMMMPLTDWAVDPLASEIGVLAADIIEHRMFSSESPEQTAARIRSYLEQWNLERGQ